MSRQPIPGEVWTNPLGNCCTAVTALPDHPDYGVFLTPAGKPLVYQLACLTPPPELPPAELVAQVKPYWTNVYPDGALSPIRTQAEATMYALSDRIWLIHPDGRWQKCNGKEVIGDPVEVPR